MKQHPFRGKKPLPRNRKLIALMHRRDLSPQGTDKCTLLYEYLSILPSDFQHWRAILLTDRGLYESKPVFVDREHTQNGGCVTINFETLKVTHKVDIEAVAVFNHRKRCLGSNLYDDGVGNPGDIFTQHYQLQV